MSVGEFEEAIEDVGMNVASLVQNDDGGRGLSSGRHARRGIRGERDLSSGVGENLPKPMEDDVKEARQHTRGNKLITSSINKTTSPILGEGNHKLGSRYSSEISITKLIREDEHTSGVAWELPINCIPGYILGSITADDLNESAPSLFNVIFLGGLASLAATIFNAALHATSQVIKHLYESVNGHMLVASWAGVTYVSCLFFMFGVWQLTTPLFADHSCHYFI